ncbi:MAG: DNA cytosine methyltransferase, partial [Epsilonproteobacteria bacterium]|nr:DNA cytosine methyltransferase [Campylobacterota bacterium]
MNYKKILISIYNEATTDQSYVNKLEDNTLNNISILAEKCFSQKGVYTVFTTLSVYKIVHPEQDIRNHQTQINNGFSGRSIDTNYITPTLKELGLPSMAESGWLTRSLEQPYPYTLDYEGKISNIHVKKAFLELINDLETLKTDPKFILVELFRQIITIQKSNQVIINPLKMPEKLTITKVIDALEKQFSFKYHTFSGAKLPVLAFYSIYQILMAELTRYKECTIKELGKHTASDRTSKSSGDIEIFKNNQLFESIEIKLDKAIDANIVRIVQEKIFQYNPSRYYILSYYEVKEIDKEVINQLIEETKKRHGCQIVVNGLLPTLKYYLRLIENL